MNQTKKRLSIINLAISITDIETIQLQILKLVLLITDTKIQEIITVLQAENYAKAQRLIKVYIDTPMEEILQRSSQQKNLDIHKLTTVSKEETIISDEDQKIIDEFQLFSTATHNKSTQKKKKEIDINDYLTNTSDTPNTQIDTQEANFDTFLNMKADEIMTDNIELDTSKEINDSFFTTPVKEEEEEVTLHTENIPRDTFFDIDEEEEPAKEVALQDNFETHLTVGRDRKASLIKDALMKKGASEKSLQAAALRKKISTKPSLSQTETTQNTISMPNKRPLESELFQTLKPIVDIEDHPPISYIRQKFSNMKKEYDPIQTSHERFSTVETFLTTISQEGYKEKEIKETLGYVEKLITEEKFAEASQLLLLCASTASRFAQLMLARELYRGILLRKNVTEAFALLTQLSQDNYPEALCDLGQFYEHAIGTGKNKKKAVTHYKRAMDLGIKRAEKHYTRLKKQKFF